VQNPSLAPSDLSATVPSRVTLKRFLFVIVLALFATLVTASSAPAGNFDEEKMGCGGEAPATCPTGTVGQPYLMTIYLGPPDGARGEDWGCATFHVTSGTFPPGLSIQQDEGTISGTPTQAGSFRFYLTVKYDKNPGCAKAPSDDEFILNVNPGVPQLPKLTIGPETTTPATVGKAYSLQMTANLSDSKTWSVASGTLPTGLTLNSSSGLISGSPTAAGTYTFTVQATIDAQRTDTKTLTIAVRNPLVIGGNGSISPETRSTQTEVGVRFSAHLTVTGGQPPYAVAQTGSLPDGIEFDVSDNSLSGQATTPGTYRFTLSASDFEGRVATYAGTIVVAPRLAIATRKLKNGRVGGLYRAKLVSRGGVGPLTWRIKAGPIPRGIRFNRTTGTFVGNPVKAGTWVITVEIVDALRVKSTATMILLVKPALARRGNR
jgi:large repetitive protein